MAVDLFGSSRDRLFEDDDEEQELGFGSVRSSFLSFECGSIF